MAAAGPNPTPTEPRRFSIRLPRPLWTGVAAVVLLVIAVALRLGVPIYRQQSAIEKIEQVGGSVGTQPGGPAWLGAVLGGKQLNEFDEVRTVDLGTTQATDATLGYVGCLLDLKELSLYKTQVTDAGLEHLQGLTKLERLVLQDTAVTNRGLEHLNELTSLHSLVLRNTQVTDSGLAYLKGLPRLRVLYLDNTQVTDAGLEHLKGLTSLESVTLMHTQVTDAGIAELRRALPELRIAR